MVARLQVVAGDAPLLRFDLQTTKINFPGKTAVWRMDFITFYPAEVPPLPSPCPPQAPFPKSPDIFQPKASSSSYEWIFHPIEI